MGYERSDWSEGVGYVRESRKYRPVVLDLSDGVELVRGKVRGILSDRNRWQRGQVENVNRQWRWWFSRCTDLSSVEPEHVDHVASIINGQRRCSLDFQSPAALKAEATVR